MSDRLVLRPLCEQEAEAQRRAILESLEHLRPWMPWARQEPESVAAKRERIRQNLDRFEIGTDLAYGVLERATGRVIGGSGLHDRAGDPGIREIGYWVHVDFVNRGIATEVTAMLTRAGFACEAARMVEVHCDPANVPSAAVPRKLGFRLREVLPEHRPGGDGQLRDGMVWEMRAEDFADSRAAAFGARMEGRPEAG